MTLFYARRRNSILFSFSFLIFFFFPCAFTFEVDVTQPILKLQFCFVLKVSNMKWSRKLIILLPCSFQPKPRIDYTLKAVGGSLTALPGISDMIDVSDT